MDMITIYLSIAETMPLALAVYEIYREFRSLREGHPLAGSQLHRLLFDASHTYYEFWKNKLALKRMSKYSRLLKKILPLEALYVLGVNIWFLLDFVVNIYSSKLGGIVELYLIGLPIGTFAAFIIMKILMQDSLKTKIWNDKSILYYTVSKQFAAVFALFLVLVSVAIVFAVFFTYFSIISFAQNLGLILEFLIPIWIVYFVLWFLLLIYGSNIELDIYNTQRDTVPIEVAIEFTKRGKVQRPTLSGNLLKLGRYLVVESGGRNYIVKWKYIELLSITNHNASNISDTN